MAGALMTGTRTLDFYFYIGSTYTYLAIERAEAVAAQAGISLRWRPFDVRAIMLEQNNRPFIGKPVKLEYMWRDLARRAQRYGIAFKSVPEYGGPRGDPGLANRLAVVAALEGWCPEYTRATYRAWFLENQVPGEMPHVRNLIAELGRDPDDALARADSDEIRNLYGSETENAKAMGIFGAPTFVWGGEIFWGDDRLEDAIDWALSHPG